MLEVVTNELRTAKRTLGEIARQGLKKKKEPGTFCLPIATKVNH